MEISDIETSLSHGRFYTGKGLALLYFGFISTLILPLVTILLIVLLLEFEFYLIVALIILSGFSISFLVLSLRLLISNNKLKKNIILWLEDAIQIKAFAQKAGEFKPFRDSKHVRIQVKFKIDGKKYLRMYMGKGEGIQGMKGYLRVFRKYEDREIDILYSSKYDQVLILKNIK